MTKKIQRQLATAKDKAAQHRTQHAAGAPGDRVDAHRLAALIRRKDLRDDGHALAESMAPPVPCTSREPISIGITLRESAEHGAGGEDKEAQVVHAYAAEHIGHAPKGEQQNSVDQQIPNDDPDHPHHVGV